MIYIHMDTSAAKSTQSEATASHYETIDVCDEPQAGEEETEPYYSQIITVMDNHGNAECDMNKNILSYDIVQRSKATGTSISRSGAVADSVLYDDVLTLQDVKNTNC